MTRPIYLDHNATTPLDSEILEGMMPYFSERYGNPSSATNFFGAEAATAIHSARTDIATAIGARSEDIIFTGTCTEANNLAILGVANNLEGHKHFITSSIEHPSVLETFHALESRGHTVTYLPVDHEGSVSPDHVAAAITARTTLVSIMGANNEVGTVQPLVDVGSVCARAGVLFHSDLAQSICTEEIDVRRSGIHLASLSAHKAYGPKGIGALYASSRSPRVKLKPLFFGGGQERGLRPGTLSPALAVGMGLAFRKAAKLRSKERLRLRKLCNAFFATLQAYCPDVLVNGAGERRLPGNLSLSIPAVEPYALLQALRDSVSFSASSACASDRVHTSHVLLAMFGDTWRARNAFRIGVGRGTSAEDMAAAATQIGHTAVSLRSIQA